MKIAIIILLALCLISIWVVIWAIAKNYDEGTKRIVSMLDTITTYKFDDLYLKLCAISDNTWKLADHKKEWFKDEDKVKPEPPDALVVEPCPICGSVPAMYKHTELNSYCIRCSGGLSKTKYDSSCNCSICVVSDDKTAAITAWNDAVNDYIMHKNEEV
jgi:hypothetical protein